jgi:glycosyltransferase involved in cell wall biosynthesis
MMLGAERVFLEGIKCLRMHTEVEVHAALPTDGPLKHEVEKLGAPVHVTPYSWWLGFSEFPFRRKVRSAWTFWSETRALLPLLKTVNSDLVVTNTIAVPAPAMAARLQRIPHLWYIHEFGEEDHGLKYAMGRRVSMLLMKHLSSRFIVNSQAVLQKYRDFFPEDRIDQLYYAVDFPFPAEGPSRSDGSPLKILLAGSKTEGKGQDDAIRASQILKSKGYRFELILLGAALEPYGIYLKTLAKRLGLDDCVKFVDYTPNPFDHFAEADLVLICSRSEAFGRVTVEAMKLGKPVIGANRAGTLELIKDGYNGFLYECGNAVDLAGKIEALYNQRELISKLGENARDWSQRNFSLEAYASGLRAIFEKAITSRQSIA